MLWGKNQCGLDIGPGGLPFEEHSIQCSVLVKVVANCHLRVRCAEDLIVHKAFASRDQDGADVDAIVMRQGKKLDSELIFQELELQVELKEASEILQKLRQIMRKRGVL